MVLCEVAMYMPRIVQVRGSIPGVTIYYLNQNFEYGLIYKKNMLTT